jgi:hypothetical protein
MVLTVEEIEIIVYSAGGGHVKRQNLRRSLTSNSNYNVDVMIMNTKREIRSLKAQGVTEGRLRGLYSRVTDLEIQIIQ